MNMILRFTFTFSLLVFFASNIQAQQQCPFDSTDENRLARCLIRPVKRGGNVGQTPAALPNILNDLIGKSINIDLIKLRKYLADNNIREVYGESGKESDIGGTLVQDLTKVRFFVIHDTSSPELEEADFPKDMNNAKWGGNNLSNWLKKDDVPTHVFINRLGESATKKNFNAVVWATKYESGKDFTGKKQRDEAMKKRRGLFLHFELIQPRRKSKPTTYFDLAPTPGFTPKQLDRLALLYVVASYRSKRWLLPAYHLSVDEPIKDAHDDPQNFDMTAWLNSVNDLLNKVRQ